MARIRSIKPEFFDHERLCSLSFAHRLCFIGLWTQADKAGRLEDRPQRLKARLFPYDDVNMDIILRDLAVAGFIVRYEVDGGHYLAIPETSWQEHQRPRRDELESILPPIRAGKVTIPSRRSDDVVPSACDFDTHKSVGGMRYEVGGREYEESVSSEPPDGDSKPAEPRGLSEAREHSAESDDDPPTAAFPVVGAGGPRWTLQASQVRSWQGLYPTTDVLAEIRKALAWLEANPNRRKTCAGMPKFLVNWLNRATDRAGSANNGGKAREYSEFEIRRYEDWVRAVGGCRHEPPCENRATCMARFIAHLRGAA